MKAILVLEMPKNCLECPCSDIGKDCFSNDYCELIANKEIESPYEKPDWCPLKPVPSKKKERYGINRQTSTGHWETYGEKTDSVATGYNACIDEILGDKE